MTAASGANDPLGTGPKTGLLLGSSNGVAVMFVDGEVLRLPLSVIAIIDREVT